MKKILTILLVYFFVVLNHTDLIYAEDPEVSRAIVNLLECEECTEGELESVIQLGEIVVPVLAEYLQKGPSPSSLALQKERLIKTYGELKKYVKTQELTFEISKEDYVKTYADNYIAIYQIRAAQALYVIGGPDAKTALREALELPLRDDVKAVLKNLTNIGTPLLPPDRPTILRPR